MINTREVACRSADEVTESKLPFIRRSRSRVLDIVPSRKQPQLKK